MVGSVIERQKSAEMPWSKRGISTWVDLYTKEEAISLFVLASERQGITPTEVINDYALSGSYHAFWSGDYGKLLSDLRGYEVNYEPFADMDGNLDRLTSDAENVFTQNPGLYTFLGISRRLIRSSAAMPMESIRFSGLNLSDLKKRQKEALRDEGIANDEDLHDKYQELVSIFYPLTCTLASMRARRFNEPQDEWVSIGGEKLALKVFNFFWETMVFDPQWTISKFLRSMRKSLHDPTRDIYDTQGLEVSFDRVPHINPIAPSYLSPEEVVSKRMSVRRVIDFLKEYAQSEKDPELYYQMLASKVFGDLSWLEIAREFGFTRNSIQGVSGRLRDYYRSHRVRKEDGQFFVPNKEKMPFWADLFGNIEKYQQLFQEYKAMLKPSYQEYLEKFFSLQTGERDSTLQKIRDAFLRENRNIGIPSLRRGVSSAINQLTYKEGSQNLHGQARIGWLPAQNRELVKACMEGNSGIWNSFSAGDQEVLRRFSAGLKAVDIAKELEIHESTVSRIKERAIRRLRSSDRSSSPAKAGFVF